MFPVRGQGVLQKKSSLELAQFKYRNSIPSCIAVILHRNKQPPREQFVSSQTGEQQRK